MIHTPSRPLTLYLEFNTGRAKVRKLKTWELTICDVKTCLCWMFFSFCYLQKLFCIRYISVGTFDLLGPGQNFIANFNGRIKQVFMFLNN